MKSRQASGLLAAALAFAVLLLGLYSGSAVAGKKSNEHDTIREALRRGEVLPLTRILAIAQQQVAGEVIEVELEVDDEGHELVYEIKVLTPNGRVRELKIDARSGAVREIEDE
jgi:uncharacterized membrane protein YkoI